MLLATYFTYLELKHQREGPPEQDQWDTYVLQKYEGTKNKKQRLKNEEKGKQKEAKGKEKGKFYDPVERCPYSRRDTGCCAVVYCFNSNSDKERHKQRQRHCAVKLKPEGPSIVAHRPAWCDGQFLEAFARQHRLFRGQNS